MRIISGTHKSKYFSAPKNLPSRPTTDFAKEGLFNVLGNEFDIDELDILDLFSGTGNITFEFASREAKSILCVEQNFNCVKHIKNTIRDFGFNQIVVFKNDAFKYLKKTTQTFDLIFADPPYNIPNYNDIPNLVFEKNTLNENGWLIIEHDKRTNFSEHPNFFQHRKYGNVNFSIFKNLPV